MFSKIFTASMVFTKILFLSECKLMHLRVLINCQVASGIDGRHSVFMVFFFFMTWNLTKAGPSGPTPEE